jgi:hypothetical protein
MANTVKFAWHGDRVTAAMRRGADRGVFRAAHLLRNEMIRLVLDTAKTGRVYDGHQASAPGEPFASDSGRTVQTFRVDHQGGTAKATVSAGGEARRMELGTARIAPRPFMAPAIRNKRDDMGRVIADEIRKEMQQ